MGRGELPQGGDDSGSAGAGQALEDFAGGEGRENGWFHIILTRPDDVSREIRKASIIIILPKSWPGKNFLTTKYVEQAEKSRLPRIPLCFPYWHGF
jgi:hypothetical protein